jgi:hypothetical protein
MIASNRKNKEEDVGGRGKIISLNYIGLKNS